jgi:hypothetical protein
MARAQWEFRATGCLGTIHGRLRRGESAARNRDPLVRMRSHHLAISARDDAGFLIGSRRTPCGVRWLLAALALRPAVTMLCADGSCTP